MANNRLYRRIRKSSRGLSLFTSMLVHGVIILILLVVPLSRKKRNYYDYLIVNSELMQLEEFERSQPPSPSVQLKPNTENIPDKVVAIAKSQSYDIIEGKADTTDVKTTDENSADDGVYDDSDAVNYMDYYSAGINGNMKLPTFMGGDFNNFRKWFLKRFRIPFDAPDKYMEIVTVSFSIDKSGVMKNIAVRSCSSPVVEREIIRILSSAPKWEPGMFNGEASGFNLQMPVNFTGY